MAQSLSVIPWRTATILEPHRNPATSDLDGSMLVITFNWQARINPVLLAFGVVAHVRVA